MAKVEIVLDATMTDTFQSCNAKFDYRFNKLKQTPILAKPLDRGSLIHNSFDVYYSLLSAGIDFQTRVDKMIERADLYFATESDLDPDTAEFAKVILIENVKRWRDLDERMVIKEVERPFAYVLYEDENVRIVMIGKIDLLCDYHDGRNLYENVAFDHKSYEREYPAKRLNNQFCNYAFATGSNYLFVNKVGFQKTLKPEDKHKRVPLSFDPIFLEQWRQNTIKVAFEYLHCVATDTWPMNLTSCDKYNRDCEYLEVCNSSGQEAKFYKLRANYEDAEVWDVSKVLGKKVTS